ncbi:NUDIX domain-containing protein [Abortiporus biennis]|nr:NUDIX domain-containing protein [Abortiporus biennis]
MSSATAIELNSNGTSAASPKSSASLLVINTRNEVLMVLRNRTSWSGSFVFPGGNYDETQDTSFKATAVRETFEETGILLASESQRENSETKSAVIQEKISNLRRVIHMQQSALKYLLDHYGLYINEDRIYPFTEWVSPRELRRRWHTRFFVTFIDKDTTKITGARIPTSTESNREIAEVRFIHISEAIKSFNRKELSILTPQLYLLRTLSGIIGDSVISTNEEREKIRELALGDFGRMILNPITIYPRPNATKERTYLYEGDEARGGPKGCLHRNVNTFDQDGLLVEDKLYRTFDVFSSIDPRWLSKPARL